MKSTKPLMLILILISTMSIARVIPSEPYELTEFDLNSIIEIAQELDIDTSKSLRKSNSGQISGDIIATFEIETDEFLGNAQKVVKLTCNRKPDSEWTCEKMLQWLLKLGDKDKTIIRAPEDFEAHSKSYYEVLELAINTIGMKTSEGNISFMEKDEQIFWIHYGSMSGGGCVQSIKVEPSVLDLTVDWMIKNPYRASVTCR